MQDPRALHALPERLAPLFDRYPIAGVLVYGSTADGARHKESDLDLAVLPEQRVSRDDGDALHDRLVADLAHALRMPDVRLDVKMIPLMPLVLRFKALQQGKVIYARRAEMLRDELLRTAARYHDEYPHIREADVRFFSTIGSPASSHDGSG